VVLLCNYTCKKDILDITVIYAEKKCTNMLLPKKTNRELKNNTVYNEHVGRHLICIKKHTSAN